MKQVFFLIIIILWGILQARRKAMREQQRKRAQQTAAPPEATRQSAAPQIRARQAAPLGAVTAEENQSPAREQPREDRSRISPETAPDEIRAMLESTRRSKRKKREAAQKERVEEIVSPASSEQAYEMTASVQRRIRFDPNALRMFVITREVLGPPRFRKPHRPGNRER